MPDNPEMIVQKYCQFCQGPIIYDPSPPGTLWFHLLGTRRQFLCPEPINQPVKESA